MASDWGERKRHGMVVRMTLALVLMVVALVYLVAEPAPAATIISYPNFSSTAGLKLNGQAAQSGNVLRLTYPTGNYTAGTVFSETKVDPSQSFESHFALSMHDATTNPPGDGIVFVLQNASTGTSTISGGGGYMGILNVKPSLAVEFDEYPNPGGTDTPAPHVSLIRNGEEAAGDFDVKPFDVYGHPIYAWVDYDPANTRLDVYVATTDTKPATPLISDSQIDLQTLLGGPAYAGFGSGTGDAAAVHDVLEWDVTQGSSGGGQQPPPQQPPPQQGGAHPTATQVICNRGPNPGDPSVCTATVGDASAIDTPTAPTGLVHFLATDGGTFDRSDCTLNPPSIASPTTASCSVTYFPPAAGGFPAVTAMYQGDATHLPSVGSTQLITAQPGEGYPGQTPPGDSAQASDTDAPGDDCWANGTPSTARSRRAGAAKNQRKPSGGCPPPLARVSALGGDKRAWVRHKGSNELIPLHLNDLLGPNDEVVTDKHTIMNFEFLIGGQVGVNRNTAVVLVGEREARLVGGSFPRVVKFGFKAWVGNLVKHPGRLGIPKYEDMEIHGGNAGAAIKG